MSSLKDLASLIMVPSMYKDGRLDTVKPLGNSILHPDATGNNDGTDGSTPAEGNFTFSRGSNLAATRVDVNGLIEKGRENLLTYSNDFSNGTWAKSNLSVSSSNGAWEVTDNTTSGSHYIFWGGTTPASSVVTLSIEAKAGAEDYLAMRLGGFTYAFFNVANGTLGSVNAAFVDAKIEATSDGFYKCSATINTPSSGNATAFYPTDNSSSVSYTGTGAVAITIKNAQLEQGLVATDYIETGASTAQAGILEDMPRLDYSGGASCPSLLLEPQRTNKESNSELLGTYSNSVISLVNDTTSPEGLVNANKIVEAAATARHEIYSDQISFNGNLHTISFFAKAGERRYMSAFIGGNPAYGGVTFDFQTGTISQTSGGTTADVVDYGNNWYRCSFTTNYPSSSQVYLCMRTADNNVDVQTYAGDGTSGFYIWGFQVEEGSYPTSYIPTYGSSVTRSKDTTDVEDFSSFLTGEDVTYMFELKSNESLVRDDSSGNLIFQHDGGLANSFRVYRASSNSIKTTIVWFDGNITNNPAAYVINSATPKVAIRRIYSTGEWDVFVDGVKVYSATNTNFLNFTRINLQGAGTPQEIKQFLVFDTALTDSECIALTTIA